MGVVNISPESFFQGSYVSPDQIIHTALQMKNDGAEIIDIGARSTAPGSIQITVQEEKLRILSALKSLEGLDLTISIDTMHPEVLAAASRYNIHAANDISGLINPEIASIISDHDLAAILMATNRVPGDNRSFPETIEYLRMVMNRAEVAAIENIVLDPGVGRWIPERTPETDFEICRRFGELNQLNRPLLAAVSRKSFIGSVTGRAPEKRLAGTLGITASLILSGASLIRTHDVADTLDVVKVISSMRGG